MKNATLFACLMVLTLGANAQSSRSAGPVAIPPNAHSGERPNVIGGVTTIHHDAAAQAVNTNAKPASDGGPQGPPVAKIPPNSQRPGPIARK